MILENIHNCLITLDEGYEGYSPKGKRMLFGNRDCSHILPLTLNVFDLEKKALLLKNQTQISISGVQDKFSLKLHKKKLVLTDIGGTYILKPKPHNLKNIDYVPINEHLTMIISSSIFKIETAKCGLILFENNEPAYITKRFDVLKDGTRCLKEDFASVLQRTELSHGKNYKYDSSYEEIGKAIDRFLPASMVEKEKFFKLLIFNYIISNGDAHLKNYSVISYDMEKPFYTLAPAYDLLCTELHIDDNNIALEDGLYDGDHLHPSFSHYGYYAYDDFYDFGIKINLLPHRIKKIIESFYNKENEVKTLVDKSFLSKDLKQKYMDLYREKTTRLKQSYRGLI